MSDCPIRSDSQPASHHAGRSRRERQHVEILSAILDEDMTRALGLAFEHIEEFAPDPLMIDMLHSGVVKSKDPVLSAEFASLVAQSQSRNRD
jgi:hypothetical protein